MRTEEATKLNPGDRVFVPSIYRGQDVEVVCTELRRHEEPHYDITLTDGNGQTSVHQAHVYRTLEGYADEMFGNFRYAWPFWIRQKLNGIADE
ncbi:MAG: hypothetical protein HYT73_03805 [Candidatus Aenigmarchaeota archaeon]|nr:hypothetical protein [Candidatus Aenigmarchaeota archaeon]